MIKKRGWKYRGSEKIVGVLLHFFVAICFPPFPYIAFLIWSLLFWNWWRIMIKKKKKRIRCRFQVPQCFTQHVLSSSWLRCYDKGGRIIFVSGWAAGCYSRYHYVYQKHCTPIIFRFLQRYYYFLVWIGTMYIPPPCHLFRSRLLLHVFSIG